MLSFTFIVYLLYSLVLPALVTYIFFTINVLQFIQNTEDLQTDTHTFEIHYQQHFITYANVTVSRVHNME